VPATTPSVYIEEQFPPQPLLFTLHRAIQSPDPLPPSSNLSRHSPFSFGHSLQDHNSYLLLKTFAMKYSVSAIVLGFFAALDAAVSTPDVPDAGQVTITGVTYGGSGCKAGTASISHSQDWQTLTVLFDEHGPTIGPGTNISDQVKNCNLNFQVHYPPEYQYTLYNSDYSGYALLELGVTLKQTSSYWFAGFIGDKPTFQSILYGPYNGNYTITDTLPSTFWSPCGASTTLNLNTQLILTSSKPEAQGQIINGYRRAYGVNWRRCN